MRYVALIGLTPKPKFWVSDYPIFEVYDRYMTGKTGLSGDSTYIFWGLLGSLRSSVSVRHVYQI